MRKIDWTVVSASKYTGPPVYCHYTRPTRGEDATNKSEMQQVDTNGNNDPNLKLLYVFIL